MEIAAWLRGLGLERYEPAFRENEIDAEVLPELTEAHLATLGLPLGPRLKLLKTIAALREGALPSPAADQLPAAAIPAAAPAAEAERRQLTVMFCDLVGSTALSARLDPEDLRAVFGAYHRCVAAVIERAGGFVAKYMGDGVLAYFGYPRAGEHDAERAVRAAPALVEAVAGLDTAAEMRLEVRVGIATGLVVVGDLIGQGAAQEQAVVGETPNLAARLQVLAEPGTVVIAPNTRRLTAGLFDYKDLGAIEIKGLAAPVTASRVLRESGAESRFEALRATRHPTRRPRRGAGDAGAALAAGEERRGLRRADLRRARHRQVAPRPDADRSARRRAVHPPAHVLLAAPPGPRALSDYHPARTGGWVSARGHDRAPARQARGGAGAGTNDLGEAAPLFSALLSLPIGERYPPLNLTPQRQKEKTLRALVAQVEGLAARQPVLMLFEDAHWSDPTSLELFDLTIDRVPAMPVLLIVTYRPEFTAPWIGRPHVTSLGLNRLAPRQRAEMIAGLPAARRYPGRSPIRSSTAPTACRRSLSKN